MGLQAKDATMKIPGIFVIVSAAAIGALSLLPLPALAHWGHLGELAGHGHMIAAGLGAAVIAGLAGLAVRGRQEEQAADGGMDAPENRSAAKDEGGQAHA